MALRRMREVMSSLNNTISSTGPNIDNLAGLLVKIASPGVSASFFRLASLLALFIARRIRDVNSSGTPGRGNNVAEPAEKELAQGSLSPGTNTKVVDESSEKNSE